MPGTGKLTLTGQLGDVMKESAQAALTYIRSVAPTMDIAEDFFQKHDIHVHVPAGATPKDGPSAGVAMTTALASLVTGRPVDAEVAMTGEVTLTGQVLPVGGIKEKIIAARQAGITKVFLPDRNKADVDETKDEVIKDMRFVYVDHVSTVLEQALEAPRRAAKAAAPPAKPRRPATKPERAAAHASRPPAESKGGRKKQVEG